MSHAFVDPARTDRFRVIGGAGATAIVVASMVGSGVFSLTGQFGATVGGDAGVLAPWVIGGVLALCGGLSLAELGAMIPCSGGSIEFARRAFGARIGYLVAMVTILSGYLLSLAAVGLFLAEFVDRLAPGALDLRATAAIALVLAFLSQAFGLRMGFAISTALAAVKIGFVAFFAVAGLLVEPAAPRLVAAAPPGAADAPAAGLLSPAVAQATLMVSFAYLGWSTAADIAGDVRRPGRNVPLAIVAAIGIVFVLYLGTNLAYLRAIEPAAMTAPDGGPMPAIGSVAAGILFGETAGRAMTAVIALLLFSTMVSGTITAARILESMAHAGEVPAWLEPRRANGVPMRGLVVTTVAALASLAIGSLGEILGLLTVLVNVFSALSVAAVLVLRRRMPDAPRPFRVPLFPLPPIVYLALAGWSVAASAFDGGLRAVLASVGAVAVLLALRPLLARRA
jgi:APA family basic amino acid/polyamine antiporter